MADATADLRKSMAGAPSSHRRATARIHKLKRYFDELMDEVRGSRCLTRPEEEASCHDTP